MADICEIESCNNKAEYWDEMDNMLCGEHMEQDMEETGGDASCYREIDHSDDTYLHP